MIWVLLFALIFGSNTSSYVIPNMHKHARKHIEVKANGKEVVKLIKVDRKKRKAVNKQLQANFKELSKLNYSRTSIETDFEQVVVRVLQNRKILQEFDIELKSAIQGFITPEEWELIIKDEKEVLKKSIKKKTKQMLKLEKRFDNLQQQVSNIIDDENRTKEVQTAIIDFEQLLQRSLKVYNNYISNDNSQ